MPTYAKDTEVPIDRSKSEIERILQRYGATAFMYGWNEGKAIIGFSLHGATPNDMVQINNTISKIVTPTMK